MSEFPPDDFEGAPDMPPTDPRAAAVALAEAEHAECTERWSRLNAAIPDYQTTLHGVEAHVPACERLIARLSTDARRALVGRLIDAEALADVLHERLCGKSCPHAGHAGCIGNEAVPILADLRGKPGAARG